MVEVLGPGPQSLLDTMVPREINVYCDPHSRMKELVEEVVEKVQLELMNLSRVEREAMLQSLYRIVWELKTHEIIENNFIMTKLKERLQSLDIYDQMVCNCHQDSKLLQIIELVESLYNSRDNSTRHFYWNRLQEAVYTFMEEFLPHMEEEETTFQPLLSQYFQYDELKQLKETVLLEHQVWKRRVEVEKSLEAASLGWGGLEHAEDIEVARVPAVSGQVNEEGAGIHHLPDEILLTIFSYLQPNQLVSAGLVCSSWSLLTRSGQLWRQLHLARWSQGDWKFRSHEESYEPSAPDGQYLTQMEESGGGDEFYRKFLNFLPRISQGVRKISVAGSSYISDDVMQLLLKQCENSLEELDASYTLLSERAFRGVRLAQLRRLDLSGCNNITDTALKYLSVSRQLHWLSLSGCVHITDRGLAALQQHHHHNQARAPLEYVDLSGCYRLSGCGLAALTAACPDLGPENLAYCSLIEDGPYREEANGCQNLDCEVRSCCSKY